MKKIFRIIFCLFFASAVMQNGFAVDVKTVELYGQIDQAFTDKSSKQLDGVLRPNAEETGYYLLENYTMKKIRRLVLSKDYDFALQANLVVIDNNLENTEAVEMYSTISSSLEQQKKVKLAMAEKKAEQEKIAAAEKEKTRLETKKDYQTIKDLSGSSVYIATKNERYTAQSWKAMFGMVNGVYVTETSTDYGSARYGISGDFKYSYNFDKFTVGINADADIILLPFTGKDDTILSDIGLIPQLGFIGRGGNFLFRLGFDAIMTIDMGSTTVLQGNVFSPALGIGFDKVMLGDVDFSGSVDYLLGHLAYDNLKCAVKGQINFGIPVTEMDRTRVTFNLGLKDTLFVKESSVENRCGIVLAFGVENVTK